MIESLCKWLASMSVSTYFASTSWIVPTVQSIHIVCVGVVFASMCMLSFRLLGISAGTRPVTVMANPILSWLWPALLLLLLTGAVMITAEPERELLNTIFMLKMLLVATAALACGILRRSLKLRPQFWDGTQWRVAARSTGVFFLILWTSIIVCGRWIAYTQ
jgi:hypothetical protein